MTSFSEFSQYERPEIPLFVVTSSEIVVPYNYYRVQEGTFFLVEIEGMRGDEWMFITCMDANHTGFRNANCICTDFSTEFVAMDGSTSTTLEIGAGDLILLVRETIIPDDPNSGRWRFARYRDGLAPAISAQNQQTLFSEEVIIPPTQPNTDVTIIAQFVTRIIDVRYKFATSIASLIRINKALIGADRITLNASLEIQNSSIIFIGNR